MPTKKFQKGDKKPPNSGRKKGTPNKFTTLKKAFLDAFEDKRIGGTEGLTKVYAKNDMRKMEFFKLISKMLPSNMNIEGDIKVTFQISEKFVPKTGNEKK